MFIVGLEEGVLPHREAVDAGNVDEERRLLYVGLTRAQESCTFRIAAPASARGKESRRAVAFLAELAQDDLRFAERAPEPGDAARDKEAGNARLRQMRAMLAR